MQRGVKVERHDNGERLLIHAGWLMTPTQVLQGARPQLTCDELPEVARVLGLKPDTSGP